MKRMLGTALFLSLLCGCSGAGYLPYAPHALDPAQLQRLVSTAAARNGVPIGLVNACLLYTSQSFQQQFQQHARFDHGVNFAVC